MWSNEEMRGMNMTPKRLKPKHRVRTLRNIITLPDIYYTTTINIRIHFRLFV